MSEREDTKFENIKPQNKELTSIISQILNILTHNKIYPVGESNVIVEKLKSPRMDPIPIEEIMYYALAKMNYTSGLTNELHEWANQYRTRLCDTVILSSDKCLKIP